MKEQTDLQEEVVQLRVKLAALENQEPLTHIIADNGEVIAKLRVPLYAKPIPD